MSCASQPDISAQPPAPVAAPAEKPKGKKDRPEAADSLEDEAPAKVCCDEIFRFKRAFR